MCKLHVISVHKKSSQECEREGEWEQEERDDDRRIFFIRISAYARARVRGSGWRGVAKMIFVKEILRRTREEDRKREGEKNVFPTPEH